MVCKALCLIDQGGSSPFYIYIKCIGMQGLYDQLTRGVHLPCLSLSLYIYAV